MKYSLKQLKRYVPQLSAISLEEIADKVWGTVAEIESIENLGKKYEGLLVAKIISVEDHPSSEKLIVVKVDYGAKEPCTVVTAAKNIAPGDFVPYIPVGGTVPAVTGKNGEPIVIVVREMVGISSEGMLASEKEVGVSDDHEGIMILHQEELRSELVAGAALAPYIECDDVIFEIENKSLTNRGDCFSAAGLARELSTIFGFSFEEPEWQKPSLANSELMGASFDKEFTVQLAVEVEAQTGVERYTGIVLDGIQVKKSPLWLRMFLQKHGMQSVNNVVDITNYVLLDYGQPMHAFDAGTLAHTKRDTKIRYVVKVRHAHAGEKLKTLDGKERILPESSLVIADEKNSVAIAGIIGGSETGITEKTTRVVLESAVFDKYSIRHTSMSLGVNTDASVVFSRKQDPEKTGRALLRAIHLLEEMAGAVVVSPVADEYIKPQERKTIIVSHEKVETFIGVSLAPQEITKKLQSMGFEVVRKNDMYKILVPTWRNDVEIDEDIYEEIARHFGYRNIIPVLPTRGIFGVAYDKKEQVKQYTLGKLIALGMVQSMNFSFVSRDLYDSCNISTEDLRAVVNAISPDVQYMRKQVLPGLLSQAVKNQYVRDTFALFEMGKVSRKSESYTSLRNIPAYLPKPKFEADEIGLPIEDEHVAMVVLDSSKQPGFFTAKYYLEKYLKSVGINEYSFTHMDDMKKSEVAHLPIWISELTAMNRLGRTVILFINDTPVGIVGEPNTLVKKAFGITKNVGLVEVSLSALEPYVSTDPIYREPSRYPAITEDYCFAFDKKKPTYSEVYSAYEKALKKHAHISCTISPRDIYQKDNGVLQITHRLVFQSAVDAEVTPNHVKDARTDIVRTMKETLGGILV